MEEWGIEQNGKTQKRAGNYCYRPGKDYEILDGGCGQCSIVLYQKS
jgi:hypothetical protein